MSKIVTNTYLDKLNLIIDEYEFSKKLEKFIEFNLDELTNDYSGKENRSVTLFSNEQFEKVKEIKHSKFLRKLFSYINVICNSFNGQFLHIHINVDLTDEIMKNITTFFVWDVQLSGIYNRDNIAIEINNIIHLINREIILTTETNGRDKNRIFREKKGLRHKKRLYEHILENSNETADLGVLLNMNISNKNSVQISEFSNFPNSSNCILNFGNKMQDVYQTNLDTLQNIRKIINLFPSISGNSIWYGDFIKENVDMWNAMPNYNFNKIITITSGEKSIENLLKMEKYNKFQSQESYTIFQFEL